MALSINIETGCYNPGVEILNQNTNETNTVGRSLFRYPSAYSGVNFYLFNFSSDQFAQWFTPTDLDTCVVEGQKYFYCVIDSTAPIVDSYITTAVPPATGTRTAKGTCGVPQDIPENLLSSCITTPTAVPVSGGSSTGTSTSTGTGGSSTTTTTTTTTTVTGGTGPAAVYGSIAHGSYVRSSVISCSTASVNSESGTVGSPDDNPEFFVADTNSKFIMIQYNGNSRKLQAGETLTFTVSEVTKVTMSGSFVGMAWTPVFNRTYGNKTYTFTVESVHDLPSLGMAHVKVGTTTAKFKPDLTITGPNGLSFKVKAGRNIQTRAAIYGRWEFNQKKVYWMEQVTRPSTKSSDLEIIKTDAEILGGTGIATSDLDQIEKSTKNHSVTQSGSIKSTEILSSIDKLATVKNLPESTFKAVKTNVKNSDMGQNVSTAYNIDSSKNIMDAIKGSLTVNTNYVSYDHPVKGITQEKNKPKLIHTNPVSGSSKKTIYHAGGDDKIDSKKTLEKLNTKVDVNKDCVLQISSLPNYDKMSNLKSSDIDSIKNGNTETGKKTAEILNRVHTSANTSITDTNGKAENYPYNGNPGPTPDEVKKFGPVNTFDKLPKSTSTLKIQPYGYDADERMDKTFNFSLTLNMFASPCGPCYTVCTQSSSSSTTTGGTTGNGTSSSTGTPSCTTCSPRIPTPASYSLPFAKTFLNNLTPEAERWSRITKNYNDNLTS